MADIESVLVSEEAIRDRVSELGRQIADDLSGAESEVVIVAVLTGSVIFVADLVRALPLRLHIGLTAVSSYPGRSTQSQGAQMQGELPQNLAGKHVLLVDDILDTGRTIRLLRGEILKQSPASLRTCVIVRKDRPQARECQCEYVGFDIPDAFVVGYGLDYNNEYRNLPFIGTLRREAIK